MPRRSTRRRSSSNGGDDAAEAEPARRVSSRATKFASSFEEPKDNLRDYILPPATPEVGRKARAAAANKKRRVGAGASARNTSDDDSDVDMADSSDAKAHAKPRNPNMREPPRRRRRVAGFGRMLSRRCGRPRLLHMPAR